MPDYPSPIVPAGHIEPVPRRVRAMLGGVTVLDTVRARYVWEWPRYPQYYVPLADVRADLLVAEGRKQVGRLGTVEEHALLVGDVERPRAAKVVVDSSIDGLSGTVRFHFGALDAWFEEDDQVFVHPRDPYVRVDALHSTRTVRIELGGAVLAESAAPVMVFETGLPTRYYLPRTEVDFGRLIATDTVTACPYKGVTGGYWSARVGDELHSDLAWCYTFPTRELLPIAGRVAFYNERVDVFVDGDPVPRPRTHFS